MACAEGTAPIRLPGIGGTHSSVPPHRAAAGRTMHRVCLPTPSSTAPSAARGSEAEDRARAAGDDRDLQRRVPAHDQATARCALFLLYDYYSYDDNDDNDHRTVVGPALAAGLRGGPTRRRPILFLISPRRPRAWRESARGGCTACLRRAALCGRDHQRARRRTEVQAAAWCDPRRAPCVADAPAGPRHARRRARAGHDRYAPASSPSCTPPRCAAA